MSTKSSARKTLTRRQQRDLDVEIPFLEGIVRRDPDYVDALKILGDDYTKRGKFAQGLGIDKKLAELRPADYLVHYNLACSYALTERFDEAITSLERALDLGFRDFRWLAKDPDLARLRKHSGFRKIRAKVKSMQIKVM